MIRAGSRTPPLGVGTTAVAFTGLLFLLSPASCPLSSCPCPSCVPPSWKGATNAVLADDPVFCTKLTVPISWFSPRGAAGGTALRGFFFRFVAGVCFGTFFVSLCPEPQLDLPGAKVRSREQPC